MQKNFTSNLLKRELMACSKPPSEYMDPCQEFANRSIKCMRRNAGDRDMCTDYFQ
jgi:cytochrome c oxidase assembly protein subunit 23